MLLKLKFAYVKMLTIKILCSLINMSFINVALITFNYYVLKKLIEQFNDFY